MSNDTPPAGDPSGHEHRPNWGSAYPSPGPGGYPPPNTGGYPPPPGYGYGYPQYPAPQKHPNATTSMVLGIVAVAGGFMCYLPLLIAPFAWFMGSRAVKEIDASGGAQGGRGEATAGKVLGIIGTVLLALALAAIILLVVLALTVDNFWAEFWEDDTYQSVV